MQLNIPEFSLVLLIGASGSGKTTFAKKHFKDSEIISSDVCRAMISNDENDQSISGEAFELLHYIVGKRLKHKKLTVVDATNLNENARENLKVIAGEYHAIPVAIVFDVPFSICEQRNSKRENRNVKNYVIKRQVNSLRGINKKLKNEGFRRVNYFDKVDEIDKVEIIREPLWNNKMNEKGPFDIIGDIHGCYDELCELLEKLGYRNDLSDECYKHPDGRKVIFLGDLVDRGPGVVNVLKLAMNMVNSGTAYCLLGNHENKLIKWVKGKKVTDKHGFLKTRDSLDKESEEFLIELKDFLTSLISHYVFDEGKLVVAHAGLKEELQGRGSGKVKEFALYGERTGEIDEFGLPVREDWSIGYRGKAIVVYGHTPQMDVVRLNNTINIDTGCVFGGKLTAFSYPEKEFTHVKAKEVYYEPIKPLSKSSNIDDVNVIDYNDIMKNKIITTRTGIDIFTKEENKMAALEVMGRFSVPHGWLVYLPPTMSPSETSEIDNILEHPKEVFNYYEENGVEKVICEEKHMGSRVIVIVCKDEKVAKIRFLAEDNKKGICYTRTGKYFFNDTKSEDELIERVNGVLTKNNFWEDFNTKWAIFDCEFMPWSKKARALLANQYAPVGKSGSVALKESNNMIGKALDKEFLELSVKENSSGMYVDINGLYNRFKEREDCIERYIDAYRQYCWKADSIDDLKIAPFHILATEKKVHNDKDHIWHLSSIKKYFNSDKIFINTNNIIVDVANEESINKGVQWWMKLTENGGEGMVVKPIDFISKNETEFLQPAIKCRGREYLRIIYGPEYTMKGQMKSLKKRSLKRKRMMAIKEFLLGIESLERFIDNEPLYRIHECVFNILAMESEPIDPRL